MIYTLAEIRTGTGFPRDWRFVPLSAAKEACNPESLEAIADDIVDAFPNKREKLADALRAIARKQRALLEGHK